MTGLDLERLAEEADRNTAAHFLRAKVGEGSDPDRIKILRRCLEARNLSNLLEALPAERKAILDEAWGIALTNEIGFTTRRPRGYAMHSYQPAANLYALVVYSEPITRGQFPAPAVPVMVGYATTPQGASAAVEAVENDSLELAVIPVDRPGGWSA